MARSKVLVEAAYTDTYKRWLHAWMWFSALGGFVWSGNAFATVDESSYGDDDMSFNVGAAFGGAIGTVIAAIPVALVVVLLSRIYEALVAIKGYSKVTAERMVDQET